MSTRHPRRAALAGLTRRAFLGRTSALLATAAAPPGSARAEAAPADAAGLAVLRRSFDEPPAGARPMTRWWWFGGAVTPAEITRQLTFMKEAGLRGAEIQPVYPVAADDPARGVLNLRYYTDAWFAVLRHAVREARRLGLQLDFTLGSGWPYGGPFIPTNLAARRLRLLSQDVAGPRELAWDLTPQLTGDDRVVAVVAAPVVPSLELDLARAQVLGDQPTRELAQGVRRGSFVRGRVGDGAWRVMVFLDSPTGQQVKRPTLGMEGNVLDHHSVDAMALFLRAAGDRVMDALAPEGAPPFHSVFCDSLEVYGADWTEDFVAEFRKRRGYDLAPLLPALWHEAGELTPHVRHDAHLTLSELNLERFFAPLVAWAQGRGMKARIQAHGAPSDVMRAYGLAHIPEGENIFLGDRYQVNLRHRRLASSAAHLYGKPLASSETYTWLRTPLFTTTLEQMKPATDAVLLDGLNHIVNHGYSYSPALAGEPGWSFYASTEANHTNTWWRHYPHLARYVARACALLQQGVSVNPVAIYLPLPDLYAQFGAGGLHIDVEAEGLLEAALLNGLRQAGYDFDLVHDHALESLARVENAELVAGTARYAAVIVPGARFMPPESLERLAELARAGGHVIFAGRLPEGAAGLERREDRGARVKRALGELFAGEPRMDAVVRPGRGTAALVSSTDAVLRQLGSVLRADFHVVEPNASTPDARKAALENVGFVHRRAGAVDYYFVANVSPQTQQLRVAFAAGHRAPSRWDPETGAVLAPLVYEYMAAEGQRSTEVELRLEPYESCFVVFGQAKDAPLVTRARWPGRLEIAKRGGAVELSGLLPADEAPAVRSASGGTRTVPVEGLPAPFEIPGPWTLRLGEKATLTLPRLVSWDQLDEGRAYSGWASYEAEFELGATPADVEWLLDLGTVHETAEASLNGTGLGAAWKGLRRLACGSALRPGRNRLKVDVANLWIHHVAASPAADWRAVEESFGIRWGRYGEVKPEKIPPAGLLGPVRLVPLRRVRLRL
jgi:hypothetical protein